MNHSKIFRKNKVIELDDFQVTHKDVITVKDVKDFSYLAGFDTIIYKLGRSYYIPLSDVVYIWTDVT